MPKDLMDGRQAMVAVVGRASSSPVAAKVSVMWSWSRIVAASPVSVALSAAMVLGMQSRAWPAAGCAQDPQAVPASPLGAVVAPVHGRHQGEAQEEQRSR